jgi:hypothetical protein
MTQVIPHGDLRGLQVADVLASSLGAALTPHPTSQIPEHRYLKALWGRVYRHKGHDDRIGECNPRKTELASHLFDSLQGIPPSESADVDLSGVIAG